MNEHRQNALFCIGICTLICAAMGVYFSSRLYRIQENELVEQAATLRQEIATLKIENAQLKGRLHFQFLEEQERERERAGVDRVETSKELL